MFLDQMDKQTYSKEVMKKKSFVRRLLCARLRGNGSMYVLFILGTAMAGAFVLTGGLTPQLNPTPKAADQVEIDEASANRSSQDSLQLVDIKIKPTATPTPTPLPLTPTPTQVACLNRTVITLMVDLSQSMLNDGKIGALNAAMADFTNSLNNETVIGGIAFGAESFMTDNTEGVKHLMGYITYGSDKNLVNQRLAQMTPGEAGGTFIRNGFQVTLNRVRAVKPRYPGYKHVAIFFSDGVPEMFDYRTPTCYARDGEVCWARQQDPRSAPFGLNATDYTTQLKSEVDKVYSVAIYNSSPGTRGATLTPQLQTLLRTIATGGNSPYYQAVDLRTGQVRDLTSYFRSIIDDVCK